MWARSRLNSEANGSCRSDDLGSTTTRAVDVETEGGGLRPHLRFDSEQREVDDLAREEGRCGAQDAFVVALGQHDVLTMGPGAFEQHRLEHQWRDHGAARDVERAQQGIGRDVLLEHAQRGVDLALRAPSEEAAGGRHDASRVVRVVGRGDDRQALVEPADESHHVVARPEPAVEHDARQ